ncbi:MAG: Na+/H+ antiporter subunit E [candidate division KSB1 bacterium]|jgi:multicomponent Na+:H+ antiporter subunit E|nr:Na+/H+ antiporter subunit E [candidate division KSB1 bacterium]
MIKKIFRLIPFTLFYIKEIIIANIRVAIAIVSPKLNFNPGVVAVPLSIESDLEILALANLITMTPGTLSLDVSTDRKVIYIHSLYVDDIENTRKDIIDGLEARILEVSK